VNDKQPKASLFSRLPAQNFQTKIRMKNLSVGAQRPKLQCSFGCGGTLFFNQREIYHLQKITHWSEQTQDGNWISLN
jgi:hypothetical protein